MLAFAAHDRAEAAVADVVVTVVDPAKKPLKGVAVTLGVKSFPGGKFAFHSHEAKTDAKGRATFADVVPADGRYGVYATVAERGLAFASTYAWNGKGGPASAMTLTAACDGAAPPVRR
jgi:hypothetical protein